MKITGYVLADQTAAELNWAADLIESGFVPDKKFLDCIAALLRVEAEATQVLGDACQGYAPVPASIHLVQHIKEKSNDRTE